MPRTLRSAPGDAKHRPMRCTAEPGPMWPRARSYAWVPALRSSVARCSASGTPRALHVAVV